MGGSNCFNKRRSPSNLDEWAAAYLVRNQMPIENSSPYMEGALFGAPDAPMASQQQPQKAVYGINLTSEERSALIRHIPPNLLKDTLAIFEREALYESLSPEQRLSARQRPYPPQVPAALVREWTRQEQQEPVFFQLPQNAIYPQQCTTPAMRPVKTVPVPQPRPKQPHPAALNFARASIWVRGLSKRATIPEISEAFSFFGKVIDVSLPKNSSHLHHCRWTFVNFASPQSSEAAIEVFEHAATNMALYKVVRGIHSIMADPSLPLEVRQRRPPF